MAFPGLSFIHLSRGIDECHTSYLRIPPLSTTFSVQLCRHQGSQEGITKHRISVAGWHNLWQARKQLARTNRIYEDQEVYRCEDVLSPHSSILSPLKTLPFCCMNATHIFDGPKNQYKTFLSRMPQKLRYYSIC